MLVRDRVNISYRYASGSACCRNRCGRAVQVLDGKRSTDRMTKTIPSVNVKYTDFENMKIFNQKCSKYTNVQRNRRACGTAALGKKTDVRGKRLTRGTRRSKKAVYSDGRRVPSAANTPSRRRRRRGRRRKGVATILRRGPMDKYSVRSEWCILF